MRRYSVAKDVRYMNQVISCSDYLDIVTKLIYIINLQTLICQDSMDDSSQYGDKAKVIWIVMINIIAL